ncbi:DUF1330 domain-containing protein [Tsukamurella pseudospumae]|uniref:DUF1330 domain-containing protein n=1 Tax=Tsukamurella pseudospumae TaxID=239498 RepID=UPI001E363C3D|nr:DUF1330 domain-containing protein [Tsukamurella pseudospumae]
MRTVPFPEQGVTVAKGYWVSVYRVIRDPERLAAYDELARVAVQAGGGRLLSRDGRVTAYEQGVAERTIVIEFDSFEQAVATRESAAYQEALAALGDAVERDFRIVEGLG